MSVCFGGGRVFTHLQFDQGTKWGNDIGDEAVMERVREYSGIVSVSSYRCDEKSVFVATRDFHSLPTNPVISHKVISQKTDLSG